MSAALAAFLAARLDEDEEIAKRAKRNGYPVNSGPLNGWWVKPGYNVAEPITLAAGTYAACHGPDRTLREIEGIRSILARYEDCLARMDDPAYPQAVARDQAREYEDFVLPPLAAVYSDSPGYREEWKL
jgi:hypothetical protein